MMRIVLSERETALLFQASRRSGESVPLAFGSSVWLLADKAPWAAALLREWRGVNFSDGGGI
jgi:hypothetical protein